MVVSGVVQFGGESQEELFLMVFAALIEVFHGLGDVVGAVGDHGVNVSGEAVGHGDHALG